MGFDKFSESAYFALHGKEHSYIEKWGNIESGLLLIESTAYRKGRLPRDCVLIEPIVILNMDEVSIRERNAIDHLRSHGYLIKWEYGGKYPFVDFPINYSSYEIVEESLNIDLGVCSLWGIEISYQTMRVIRESGCIRIIVFCDSGIYGGTVCDGVNGTNGGIIDSCFFPGVLRDGDSLNKHLINYIDHADLQFRKGAFRGSRNSGYQYDSRDTFHRTYGAEGENAELPKVRYDGNCRVCGCMIETLRGKGEHCVPSWLSEELNTTPITANILCSECNSSLGEYLERGFSSIVKSELLEDKIFDQDSIIKLAVAWCYKTAAFLASASGVKVHKEIFEPVLDWVRDADIESFNDSRTCIFWSNKIRMESLGYRYAVGDFAHNGKYEGCMYVFFGCSLFSFCVIRLPRESVFSNERLIDSIPMNSLYPFASCALPFKEREFNINDFSKYVLTQLFQVDDYYFYKNEISR